MASDEPKEVKDMREELEQIQAYIDDKYRLVAAQQGDKQESMKNMIKQLIEAAFLLEDTIDKYMIGEECEPSSSWGIFSFKTMVPRRQRIQLMLEEVKSRVKEIKEKLEKQVSSSVEQPAASSGGNQDDTLQYGEEADSRESKSAELIHFLVDGSAAECSVISVVGMGGLGKTTIAKKVFESKEVRTHFECCLWITVSRSYSEKELLKDMLLQFYKQTRHYDSLPQGIFEMDSASLVELRNYLQEKRFAIFFDDVWDTNFCNKIQEALIDNMKGSRIFITTRNMDVARHFETFFNVEVYKMLPITRKESLELFLMTVCKSDFKKNISKELLEISPKIVEKCNGIPLAIKIVGNFLSNKSASEWETFSEDLGSSLEKNPSLGGIATIFTSSFDDLPSFLKPCLLYFGIYPQNFEVSSKRLIRQWTSEGFVKPESGVTLEEVAERYLMELIDRSLVLVSTVGIDDKVKGCRVHDLIHEMIQKKVSDLCFSGVISEDNESVLNRIVRRLSIANASDDLMESVNSSWIRSLYFFTEEELPEDLLKKIPRKCKLLKVLDFESAKMSGVPENIGELTHVKYLSFKNTNVQSLPKSIGKLLNLETLDLKQTDVKEVPQEVGKLEKMRHLLGDKLSSIHLKGGIGGMSFLQTLNQVGIDQDGTDLITELGKLIELRKLSLFDVPEEHGIALCSSINNMQQLEKLYIETKSKDNTSINLSSVSHPTMLRKLRLQAKLNELPEWIPKLENLVELSLSHSHLTEDPLKSLMNLPKLVLLNLAVHSYEGESLHFQRGGFQNLKELGLKYLYRLNSIAIDEGVLQSLKELTLMYIPNLKKAPSGIIHLEKLKVLNSHFMANEFEQSIAPFIKDRNIL